MQVQSKKLLALLEWRQQQLRAHHKVILRKYALKSVVAFVVLQKCHAGSTELLHQHICEAGPDIFQVQRGLLCKLQNHVLGLRSESGHIKVIREWLVNKFLQSHNALWC